MTVFDREDFKRRQYRI